MIRNPAVAVFLAVIYIVSTLSVAADQVSRTYLHRSRGADLRAVDMTVAHDADGIIRYTIDDFPPGRHGSKITLLADADGKPVEYVSAANQAGGYKWKLAFETDKVVITRKMPGKPEEKHTCAVRPGLLPDLNSRPDPCLAQHLLIRAYDFSKGGKQVFDVYDIDNTGRGLAEYQVSLELADEDGVVLPNGKFKAKHLAQVQQSSAPTWYKKRRGSRTDIWVNDKGAILRIYRHREPYELILQNYDKLDELISASASTQGHGSSSAANVTTVNGKEASFSKPPVVTSGRPANVHHLTPMTLHLCASVDLSNPASGGTVNYLSTADFSPGGFICNVGPAFTMAQASEIDLAFPYEGGAVTATHTGLRLTTSSLAGITDIEVPANGKLTKLSYRLSAMPGEGEERTFELYFYPSFPREKATGWGNAKVRRIDKTLLFSSCSESVGGGKDPGEELRTCLRDSL